MNSSSDAIEMSVVIPTCGRPDYLRRSIQSVGDAARAAGLEKNQLEVLAVDDGHSPETPELVNNALEADGLLGRCLRTLGGPHAGPSVARHQGICAAHGDLIYILDDDDQFLSNRFERSLEIFRSGNADVVLELSLRCYDDSSGRPPFITGPYETNLSPFEFLLAGGGRSHITPGATAFTRSVYLECGGYDRRLRYGEDGELLLRLCLYGRVALLAGEPVCRYSIHRSNTSRSDNLDYWQNMFSLGKLHKKVRRGRKRWPQAYRFLRHGGVVSGKLDFCLSRVRLESKTYPERLRRGLRVIQYFPLDCLRWNNLKTIGIWLTKCV